LQSDLVKVGAAFPWPLRHSVFLRAGHTEAG
jgi:hypothetical protein